MAKPMKTLELHYPTIQYLIKALPHFVSKTTYWDCCNNSTMVSNDEIMETVKLLQRIKLMSTNTTMTTNIKNILRLSKIVTLKLYRTTKKTQDKPTLKFNMKQVLDVLIIRFYFMMPTKRGCSCIQTHFFHEHVFKISNCSI